MRVAEILLLLLAAVGVCQRATAQDLEPRAYINLPVGLNFVAVGYTHSDGGVGTDPSVPLDDARMVVDTVFAGYVRSLGIGERSAKLDVIVPYSWLEGSARAAGELLHRSVDGFADPSVRLAVNLFGAPALTRQQFSSYRQDLIVGASLRVTAPLGQYDRSRFVNIGANRWTFKPEIGVSKRWNSWSVDLAVAATLFTDNDATPQGASVQQAPLISLQSHVIRTFPRGIWAALDATWYAGGQTTIDGIERDDRRDNSRIGLTLAFPIDAANSLKLYAATGVSERVGTNFDTAGIAWQYRWATDR